MFAVRTAIFVASVDAVTAAALSVCSLRCCLRYHSSATGCPSSSWRGGLTFTGHNQLELVPESGFP
jgi:hypothetical protein